MLHHSPKGSEGTESINTPPKTDIESQKNHFEKRFFQIVDFSMLCSFSGAFLPLWNNIEPEIFWENLCHLFKAVETRTG